MTELFLNVLMILMGISGPTQVAGLNGTTAAFLAQPSHATAQASVARIARGK
jgi:hypothetical protein